MLQTPLESQKEILGYRLLDRIGSGGFGEVWSAVAPGGLKKAVKVVYGFHDGHRAQAELKALDRVKELRHPFLLSLERIEISDGQLIVVSELADGSLADRFNEYLVKGEQGIPREEMLRYLLNAAEALDYLSDEHNLQHLDIKPENLLVVGSHVKVADFGLIKDLRNASQSLMSGMTPAYAAPELFDGRPASSSDQYSLAIVYQEMTTGVRPFAGETPAQLAAQHVHGKPNLLPLPKSDQATIAKALSKDPATRFRCCREMAEALANQRRATRKAIRRQEIDRVRNDTESATINFQETAGRDVTAMLSDRRMPLRASAVKVVNPPECDVQDARVRPTLILGVGATGSRIVQKVKSRLVAHHGSMDNLPAIRLLAIDADRNTLGSLRRENGLASLNNMESLETPLRKAEEYRGHQKSKTLLNWISRRWIYNIPRSLQTEGLRALGRLAFADHFETICERLQTSIREMSTSEALAKTADTLNLDPAAENPRVFLVSSISGGMGSGMVLDLAYATRLLLLEQGLESNALNGILLHSTYQRYRDPGLAVANAFAFLTEMRHCIEQGYPGDPNIGMPEFEEQAPFDATYFNDLGQDLNQSQFDRQLNRVAEYLTLSSASRCSVFFDQCRSREQELEHFALRTFGLSMAGPGNGSSSTGTSNRIARALLKRWTSATNESTSAQETASQQIQEASLDGEAVSRSVSAMIDNSISTTLDQVAELAWQQMLSDDAAFKTTLSRHADAVFGATADQRDSSFDEPEYCQAIEADAGLEGQRAGEELVSSILDQMSGVTMNLAYTREIAGHAKTQLRRSLDSLDDQFKHLQDSERQIATLMGQIPRQKAIQNENVRRQLQQLIRSYFDLRRQEMTIRYQRVLWRTALTSVDSIVSQLNLFKQQMDLVANDFVSLDEIADLFEDDDQLDMDKILNDSVECHLEALVLQTERRVHESLVEPRGGYVACLEEPSVWQGQMAFEIRQQVQQVLSEAYKKVSLEEVILNNGIEPERLVTWLNARMVEATPAVDDCGGVSRLLVGLPELTTDQTLPEMLKKQFNLDGCSLRGTQGNFVMCFEADDLSLANVAFRLLQTRPDAIELVKRIQSRNDVDWMTLDDLL